MKIVYKQITLVIVTVKDEFLASISMDESGVFIEICKEQSFSLAELQALQEGLKEVAKIYQVSL